MAIKEKKMLLQKGADTNKEILINESSQRLGETRNNSIPVTPQPLLKKRKLVCTVHDMMFHSFNSINKLLWSMNAVQESTAHLLWLFMHFGGGFEECAVQWNYVSRPVCAVVLGDVSETDGDTIVLRKRFIFKAEEVDSLNIYQFRIINKR